MSIKLSFKYGPLQGHYHLTWSFPYPLGKDPHSWRLARRFLSRAPTVNLLTLLLCSYPRLRNSSQSVNLSGTFLFCLVRR
jgi:hypothetical protein